MLALHAPSLQGASGLSLRWMQVRRGASPCPPQKSGALSTICKSGMLGLLLQCSTSSKAA